MNQSSTIMVLAILAATIAGGFSSCSGLPIAPAFAAAIVSTQTVVFSIENMTCPLCPVTVKKAMESVAGVTSVQIDFEAKTATVVYDSAITSIKAIAASSANAGYPASAKG